MLQASLRWLVFSLLTLSSLGCCVKHISLQPPTLPPPPAPPAVQQSIVTATVRASLANVSPSLDDVIPTSYDTGVYCGAFGLACVKGTLARDPVRFTLSLNHADVKTGLFYEMDGNFIGIPGSCGRPDNPKRRANASFGADVIWNANWTLGIQNGSASVTPVDRCEITAANINVTDKAIAVMNRVAEGLPAKVNDRLGSITQFREGASKAWNALQQPRAIDGQLWVDLHPESMTVSPISGTNEIAQVTIGMVAHPRIVFGAAPPAPSDPLPLLKVGQTPSDFHLSSMAVFPFESLNTVLSNKLVGQVYKYPLPILPDLKVRIDGTHVAGSGDLVQVGIDLTGSVEGTVWLVGRVVYEPATRIAKIEYVDYDIETRMC
jgi:Domain of unknown function (DUF4403)